MNDLEVEKFLLQNPDFFIGRSRLLAHIKVPHETGAISLVEKQVQILRANNQSLRNRLKHLTHNAKKNERLFSLLRELVLDALEVQTPLALKERVEQHLKLQFGLVAAELRLAPFEGHQHARYEALFRRRPFISGPLDEEDRAWLMPNTPDVQSVAVRLVQHDYRWLGVLCVGSDEPDYFHPAMESMFLDYLSEVIGRILSLLSQESVEHAVEARSLDQF